ncbi:MAG: SIMPL domain-containing protein [Pseudomonadota bacterium]
MRRGLAALGAFGLIVLVAAQTVAAEPPATLRVTGTGTVTVVPDQAQVSLGVVTIGATAAEAMAANSPKVKAIIDLLKQKGVAPADIRTSNLSIQPRYNNRQDGQAPTIAAYQVSNMVDAKISDLADLGGILDAAIGAGATNVNQLTMGYSDQDGAMDKAREAAVKDAIARAGLIAEAAGVTLGPILSIDDGAGGSPGPGPMLARSTAMEAVPIEAGSTGITARMTLVWQISTAK